ncbi:hypothetical protein [Azospirillum argentinense]|uniref:DnaB-like helicase C-terminal domain-containing protein n=1 Tax=Azospirillum argentinense TaxID=2970906 RepID=UPI0032DFD15D
MAAVMTPAAEEDSAAAPVYEFDAEFQTKIAALSVRDTTFVTRTDGLIRPDYLTDGAEASLVAIAGDYAARYKKAPDKATFAELIKEAVRTRRIRRDLVDDVKDAYRRIMTTDISDRDFVIEQVAAFAQQRAFEEAMIRAIPMIETRDFDRAKKELQTAFLVGAHEADGGLDYLEDLDRRTTERLELAAGKIKKTGITTGVDELDKILYHGGWGRKELSCLMGGAKAGKSIGLGEFAMAAALAGYNVFLATCEVSKEIYTDRLDANISEFAMKVLKDHPHEIAKKVRAAWDKGGVLKIHEYATGTLKPSQLRREIERYRMRGIVFDLIVVDYADIMAPERWTDSNTENSKSIYVDLRGIMFDYDAAGLTATQTNREGAKATTAKATDIAEDFNKVRIVDVLIGINATQDERDSNEARLFFAAMRNAEDGFTLRIRQDRARMKFIKKVLGRE